MRYCSAIVANLVTYSKTVPEDEIHRQASAICRYHFGWDIFPWLLASGFCVVGTSGVLTTCGQQERDVHALVGDAMEPAELRQITAQYTPSEFIRTRRRRYRIRRAPWHPVDVRNLWRIASIQSLVEIYRNEKSDIENTRRGDIPVAAGLSAVARYVA